MFCEQTQDLLTCYHQDELDPSIKTEVQAHLAHCPSCQTESDEIQQILSLFSSVGEFEPPAEVWQRIEADIRQPQTPALSTPSLDSHSRPRWIAWAGSLMAAAAILLLLLQLNGTDPPREVAQARLESGMLRLQTGSAERTLPIGKRFTIWPGSRLITVDGRASVALSSNSQLKLGRETSVSFSRNLIDLQRGELYLNESGVAHWEIRTPHMHLQLIGTEVELTVKSSGTRLAVIQGEVLLKNGAEPLRLTEGQALQVSSRTDTGLAQRITTFQVQQARARWLQPDALTLKAELTYVRDAAGKPVLQLRLTNTTTAPIRLSSSAGRSCQLRIRRNGKQLAAMHLPLILGQQPLQLAPGEHCTYQFDASSLSDSGRYEVSALYLVGQGLRADSRTITFRIP